MRFYTVVQLGPKQSLTPDGFLLCEEVPIARTGVQIYGPGQTSVEPGPDGITRIQRDPAEVFRPETVASFAGKSVVDDHPPDGVTPENYKELTVGSVMNVRRGPGIQDDLLLADLLIMDAGAIAAVRGGKREVSCGYDCDYEQFEPGRGRQFNIIGNHVALVGHGRCGPRCSIGDSAMPKRTVWDRIMTAFKAKDDAAMEEALKEARDSYEGGGEGEVSPGNGHSVTVNIHGAKEQKDDEEEGKAPPAAGGNESEQKILETVAQLAARMDALEKVVAQLASAEESESGEASEGDEDPPKEGEGEGAESKEGGGSKEGEGEDEAEGEIEEEDPDKTATGDKRSTKDAASLDQIAQETFARAEILLPGVKLPALDAKQSRAKTIDSLCAFRRRVVMRAYETETGKRAITPFLGGRDVSAVKKMTCDAVSTLFVGASELVKQTNNGRIMSRTITNDRVAKGTKEPVTIAEINRRNRERYGQPPR